MEGLLSSFYEEYSYLAGASAVAYLHDLVEGLQWSNKIHIYRAGKWLLSCTSLAKQNLFFMMDQPQYLPPGNEYAAGVHAYTFYDITKPRLYN